MIALIAVTLAVFALLCLSEFGWRKNFMNNETGRKFVHITVGSFVAFWPYLLRWNQIRFLSLAFLLVVVASKYFKVFKAIHSVQRPTYGEVFFAVVVGLMTFITTSKGIYAAALLEMSLADGLAAIIGVEFGVKRKRFYHVLGNTKSVPGTLAFFIASLAILTGYSLLVASLPWTLVIGLAVLASFIENVASLGLDNLLVPIIVAVTLQVAT